MSDVKYMIKVRKSAEKNFWLKMNEREESDYINQTLFPVRLFI